MNAILTIAFHLTLIVKGPRSAEVVVQLVEWTLITPEIRGSNPVIGFR